MWEFRERSTRMPRYPSDMSDDERVVIEPALPGMAVWGLRHTCTGRGERANSARRLIIEAAIRL